MKASPETKASLLHLIEELNKESKLAEKAPLFAVKKHVQRIGSLQIRFNAQVARVLCYGE